jgi:hypothetical protein
MNKVENLKKIMISIQAGTSPDTMDCTVEYPEYEFIFGLGPEGMTPFEYELVGKSVGEEVLIHLKKDNLAMFFEHLNLPLTNVFEANDDVFLKVHIDSVASADNREVVKSLAAMAAHGISGGSCGCGCGC